MKRKRWEMRIKIEPKEFFMYAVFLAFSKEHPNPEDEAIKAYLDAHELIPKAQGTDKFEDQEFDVMYFGGCYLGKHLDVIRDMQRQAVEHELLTVAIERILQETPAPETRRVGNQTPVPQMKALIANLVQEFHQDTSFGANEEGYLKVTLEPVVIEQRFLELVGKEV
jgi:hypothetical protein